MTTTVRILIRNRAGVFDPEAKVIHQGLARLGHDVVADVAVGKVIELSLELDDPERIEETVARMCEQFLVNPVVEDYSFEILASADGGLS